MQVRFVGLLLGVLLLGVNGRVEAGNFGPAPGQVCNDYQQALSNIGKTDPTVEFVLSTEDPEILARYLSYYDSRPPQTTGTEIDAVGVYVIPREGRDEFIGVRFLRGVQGLCAVDGVSMSRQVFAIIFGSGA